MLKDKGLTSRIHRKGRRNKPLSTREEQGNKTRSKVRVRVEHSFLVHRASVSFWRNLAGLSTQLSGVSSDQPLRD